MSFLLAALDNDRPATDGRTLAPLSEDLDPDSVRQAIYFLPGLKIVTKQRHRSPSGAGRPPPRAQRNSWTCAATTGR